MYTDDVEVDVYTDDVEVEMSDVGSTRPAGDGVSDEEMTEQVGEQTASDLQAEDVFERDSDGVSDPTEAAKESADEVESHG